MSSLYNLWPCLKDKTGSRFFKIENQMQKIAQVGALRRPNTTFHVFFSVMSYAVIDLATLLLEREDAFMTARGLGCRLELSQTVPSARTQHMSHGE